MSGYPTHKRARRAARVAVRSYRLARPYQSRRLALEFALRRAWESWR